MSRDYVSLTIGVLTLLVMSAAVYGILNLNTVIQSKTDQTKVQNYSAELDSMRSQINSLKSNQISMDQLQNNVTAIHEKLTNLDNLNNKISDIQNKLATLENNNQPQQISYVQQNLVVVLDKSSYLPGNTVTITIVGANPQKLIQVELLDSGQFVLVHNDIWADSAGKATYQLQLSQALPAGNYVVKVVSDQQTVTQTLTVSSSTTPVQRSNSTSSNSNGLTAQTDKATYHAGEMIQVLGKGMPNTTVTGVMTSPSGQTYSSAAGTAPDGSFMMFYALTQPYETGQWTVTVTDLGKTVTLHITITNS
jgi:prefoldin subunit 5